MVEAMIQNHLDRYKASGAELIMGTARFVAPNTVEVALNGGGTKTMAGESVFLNLGTQATIPDVPGLAASAPMTHVEALDLDRLPEHLLTVGGRLARIRLLSARERCDPRLGPCATKPPSP